MNDLKKATHIIVDVLLLMMCSGSHTQRTYWALNRLLKVLQFEADSLITCSGIVLTLHDGSGMRYTVVRQIPDLVVNMNVVDKLNELSWNAQRQQMTLSEIKAQLATIKSEANYRYPAFILVPSVAAACAAIAGLAGGDLATMLMTFLGSVAGMLVRQKMHAAGYKGVFITLIAASASVAVAAAGFFLPMDVDSHIAAAHTVLFLMPGVPLVLGFGDLMYGHITNGITRCMWCGVIVFTTAVGIVIVLHCYGINQLIEL